MAKNRTETNTRRPALLASVLVTVCCCAIVVIALCVPVVRAQLILSALPGPIAVVAAWSKPPRRR
jgi:hypothetical protein